MSATQPYADYAATIPHQVYMIFQCMFAVITPALITGAIAERISFKGFLVFSLFWTTFIYDPLAHWVWGIDGWLHQLGALDFAGGTVVHISSGTSALAAVLVSAATWLSARADATAQPDPDRDRRGLAVVRMVRLQRRQRAGGQRTGGLGLRRDPCRRGGGVARMGVHRMVVRGKPTVLGAASGAVAGLVAITPASGYVAPMSAIVIGLVAGVMCFFAVG